MPATRKHGRAGAEKSAHPDDARGPWRGWNSGLITKLVRPFFSRRFLKFATVGTSGVIVNLLGLGLFKGLGLQTNAASILAIELSLLSNFFINYAWTFGDQRSRDRNIVVQGLRFHLVSLVGAGVQFTTFVFLNMVWLFTVLDTSARAAYHMAASTWTERWLWHPFIEPPEVGRWVYLSQLTGIGGGMVWNYLLNFYWTWSMGDSAQPRRTP